MEEFSATNKVRIIEFRTYSRGRRLLHSFTPLAAFKEERGELSEIKTNWAKRLQWANPEIRSLATELIERIEATFPKVKHGPRYRCQVTLAASVWRADLYKKPFHPEQAITIQEALRAHTMGSAYAAFEENVKGSLEPGKLADLTVWGNNIYEIEPLEIWNTKIEMIMIGGKIVYQK